MIKRFFTLFAVTLLMIQGMSFGYIDSYSEAGYFNTVFFAPDLLTQGGRTINNVTDKKNAYGTSEQIVTDNILNFTESGEDTIPPANVKYLSASNITINSVNLSWGASTDNVGVSGYQLIQNDSIIDTVLVTFTVIYDLESNTTYTFIVKAMDEAGNISDASNILQVTTVEDFDGISIPLENQSFEEPATSKIKSGFDNIPGWENTPGTGNYTDSGVDQAGDGNHVDATSDGSWYAFLYSKDGSVNQTTSHNVVAGGKYKISFMVHDVWSSTKLLVNVYFESGGRHYTIEEFNILAPEYKNPKNVTLIFTVPNGVSGKLGLEFKSLVDGWIGFDNVQLHYNQTGEDTEAPSVPLGVIPTSFGDTLVKINWVESTDNIGVDKYIILIDGVIADSTTKNDYTFKKLNKGTYSVTVKAKDAAGNESAESDPVTVEIKGSISNTDIFRERFEMKVIPNPVRDMFKVAINSNEIAQISIYNSTGKLVYNNSFIKHIVLNKKQLGNTGLFIVKININNRQMASLLLIK